MIHYKLLKLRATVTVDMYCQPLVRVHEELLIKRQFLVNGRGVIFQHDNTKLHTERTKQEKLRQLGQEVLPHHPYSPDLAPYDFHLFRDSFFFCLKSTKFYEEGIKVLLGYT